ncbi:MAG: hypothetical protein JW955_16295 [Sedimentisphaerales bacterium]|nr:hypothetical protein [Sedimentisphaerales bacterium]
MGSAGGGRGGDGASDSATYWDGGGGGGGGGGPFGGDGGFGGDRSHIDGYRGKPGGYLAPGLNGDTSTDFSVFMGSGGGGGGGADQGGQVQDPCQPLAKGGPGGVEGGNGIHGASDGGGGGGGGGAAGGGMITLEATTRIDIAGELDVDGGGKAELEAGYGAGGGILLAAPTVTIAQGAISSLGGNMTGMGTSSNGGSLKIFADHIVGAEGVEANVGRVLTCPYSTTGADQYTLTISSTEGGTVEPSAGTYQYAYGATVQMTATADPEYTFSHWSGNIWSSDNPTSVTMTSDMEICANFVSAASRQHTLLISSTAGGSVTEPGEGTLQYPEGTVLTIAAVADASWSFGGWTGTAVDAGKVTDPSAATTTVTVDGDYTLQALFQAVGPQPPLTAHDPSPANGAQSVVSRTLRWTAGQTASSHNVYLGVKATLGSGELIGRRTTTECLIPCALVPGTTYYWRVDEVEPDGTTTYPGEVWSFTAGEPVMQILTVSCYGAGSVVAPGEGQFEIPHGTVLTIEAVPADSASEFQTWTGTAVEQGKVQDPNAAQTTVLVDDDYELTAVFAPRAEGPALGFSLGELTLDDAQAFEYRVSTNNTAEATFVEVVTGLAPDPNGMMRMRAVAGEAARAKARFGKCQGPRVLVRFTYLFEVPGADLEMVVYLSDVPELLGHDDPEREVHYVEIGRVPAPPAGRPGSFGSGRLGTFEVWAWTQGLDLSNGTWVELELVQYGQPVYAASVGLGASQMRAFNGSDGPSVLVGGEAAEIHCDGICMDLSGDDVADEEDFIRMIAACGRRAELLSDGEDSLRCLDGVFSRDGYVDSRDIDSWAWALGDGRRKNLCPELPLADASEVRTGGSLSSFSLPWPSGPPVVLGAAASLPGELMVMGKCRMTSLYAFSQLREDCIGLFKADMTFVLDYTQTGLPTEYNVRLVRGPDQSLYLVNSAQGVLRIDGVVEQVIPPGATTYASDPRYHEAATVYVGLHGDGPDAFGRPVLDVALDQQGRAYVVPVVVAPAGREAYVAAAELALQAGAEPPYQVVRIFDDPPPANDNQDRDQLREIEVDGLGNVYVANAHALNESDMVWKYGPDGVLLDRLGLMSPDGEVRVRDPLALQVSADGRTLYLASGQCDLANPDEAIIYKISTADFSGAGTIRITQMRQVTSLSEDPATGDLWVAGIQMPDIPEEPSLMAEPFYMPYLARVPPGTETVQAVSISDATVHDLALPTSIVYIGTAQE